jgi:hypothetical protein
MPVRRKSSPVRRRPATRRRRTMGAAMSPASIKAAVNTTLMGAAGGAAAALLTNVIGDNLGGFKNYTGLVGALATSVFFKQPVIAAGMAGYSGAKVAADLTGVGLFAEKATECTYLLLAPCTCKDMTPQEWLARISTLATTH